MAKRMIRPQEAQERLQEQLEAQDARRLPTFERLLRIRQARGRAIEKGIARRTAQHGEEDPGVNRLVGRLERNRLAREELRPRRALARQPRPTVDERIFTVRGLVLAADNRGVAGAAVHLVDDTGQLLPGAPTTTTAADGSWELKVPVTAGIEGQIFVEVRDGGETKRLADRALTMNAGSVELVVGHGIGVERRPVIDERFRPAERVHPRPDDRVEPAPAKKTPAKKSPAKKTPAKKVAKKTPAKKTIKKTPIKLPDAAPRPEPKMAVPAKRGKKARKKPKKGGGGKKKGGGKKRRK